MVESRAMNGNDKYRAGYLNRRPTARAAAGALVVVSAWAGATLGQAVTSVGAESEEVSRIRGVVLNQLTHEPISRALVYTPGEQYATLTDDRGQFEFKFPPQQPAPTVDETMPKDAQQRILQKYWAQNSRPGSFMAKRPGFLESGGQISGTGSVRIYLVPESLIVGHVNVPGSDGEVRIPVELYRHENRDGQGRWESSGNFLSWSDGEFRFAGLPAGTYKVVTGEQMDQDRFSFVSGEQLYGYPPSYYPNAGDFETAGMIQLGAGETYQANLSVARREYYPVKIPVANMATNGMQLRVHASGHPGPGYSLGYNMMEQAIEGTLPNGNYTLEAETFGGETGSTGILNFSVRGAAFEGTGMNLLPNATVHIRVREEFKNAQSGVESLPLGANGLDKAVLRRRGDVQVQLSSIEEFPSFRGDGGSRRAANAEDDELVIPNVAPGRYRVRVFGNPGYVASALSGEADLLHGELVVGLGAAVPPIEITIRDDGAEVTGTVEEAAKTSSEQELGQDGPRFMGMVYFVPVEGTVGPVQGTSINVDRTFRQEQLPPGTYRVLAFDHELSEEASVEGMKRYQTRGEVIQVSAGQQASVRLKFTPDGEGQ